MLLHDLYNIAVISIGLSLDSSTLEKRQSKNNIQNTYYRILYAIFMLFYSKPKHTRHTSMSLKFN